ncbi:helicase [Clostridium sp. W14A]|uniref:ATP-dependent RecD2 DNA helicase n=1 Tax=Caproicibacter fermentans TaxID=2576756 RepID=A0A7G8TCD4_9FIRM|nr:ATP-dependent RecD-like DNA helicase [Caproicibacter fermentans]OCN02461.1 helicase [Clostridium sp. W14A]QNK41275.1 ATP-dependent RecD-like DNA helicase [Caproicibacter fermentans]
MAETGLLEMTGTVEQIIFRNEKNGYAVIEINNGEELVTAVGNLPFVGAGEELHVVGNWITSQNYGEQFHVEAFERSKPANEAAMLKYLSSGAVKGVGPSTAKKIVELFGGTALEVMENEPERLCSVRGITKPKAEKICEEVKRLGGIRQMMVQLGGYGISPEEAVRVWKYYGAQSVDRVRENPYCLCEDGVSIGFDRADRIAASLERPQDDICRVRAGILHVIKHNMGNGHTCLPADKLTSAAARLLGVEQSLTRDVLEDLKADTSVVACTFRDREFVFLPGLYRSEVYSAERIKMLLRFPAPSVTGVDDRLAEVEREFGIQYAEGQKQAVREALSKGILILTGGPGTGKTTTLNAIIRLLERSGEKVLLAAPTGRAAKRMSELTGREAKTIHRLLQVEWDEEDRPVFARNEKNLLECDALVIDELSMVDTALFEALLRALPLGRRLILVGDSDQLPSVGPGNVIGDLIASGLLPVVQLRQVFRQSMQSLIVRNAHRIVSGEMPELDIRNEDFFFLKCTVPANIGATIVDLCNRRLPESYGFSSLTEIQVLSPSRKGELGTTELNKKLQQAINPPDGRKTEIRVNGSLFREGDKVMQVRNDYNLPWNRLDGSVGEGVFNGDLGIIQSIDRRASVITVRMDDRIVSYETETAAELELAYAMTVHKSQGNEFPAVVMPMYRGAPQLAYRNLLYTAVTRAKSLLILVGTPETVRSMVENNRKTRRYTGLAYLLTGGGEDEV